ncbi:hypothetical protein DPMN_048218 [Dreissena polymorpha]|uniref:Uncharacterized protein n=1 Tax=Dreissena polymorpha TaxID=45954 RepID=A0A9D4D9J6_DREPO|nr:hypothetical protein DPMN_048218 [Dreissena polymorpha]
MIMVVVMMIMTVVVVMVLLLLMMITIGFDDSLEHADTRPVSRNLAMRPNRKFKPILTPPRVSSVVAHYVT